MVILIALISNISIFFWIYLALKNDAGPGIIGLSKKQIILMFVLESAIFLITLLDYWLGIDQNVANDYMWHNMFTFSKGIFPLLGINMLFGTEFKNPIFVLIFGLIVNCVILFFITQFRRIAKRSAIKKRRANPDSADL